MEKYGKVIQAAILAVGLLLLGLCIKSGIDNFTNKDRRVTVKGLAEKVVDADKVTWNLSVTYVGDDLGHVPECYLKPRELDTLAIKADIKAGKLRVGTDGLERGKVIDEITGEAIQGIYATQGTALVIR